MATTNQPNLGNKDKKQGNTKNPQQQTANTPNVADQKLRNPAKQTDTQKMVNDTDDDERDS